MADAFRQIPVGDYHNDIAEVSAYQRLIPSFGQAIYINEVQISTVPPPAGGQALVIFPVRMDGIGHGGIFPGGRVT